MVVYRKTQLNTTILDMKDFEDQVILTVNQEWIGAVVLK